MAHVGWTGSDGDHDRLLITRLWLSRSDKAFDASMRDEPGRGPQQAIFDLGGDDPSDFLRASGRFDLVVIHDLWGQPGGVGGAAVSPLHEPAAWSARIAGTGARYVFVFGGDHGLNFRVTELPGYRRILVAAPGMLSVLAARPWCGPEAAAEPITYRDVTAARLASPLDLARRRDLDLSYTGVCGSRLALLGAMPRLISLRLVGTPISDDDVAGIGGCRRLQTLCLDETGISGGALEHLRGLDDLECLSLNETRIDDGGVRHLAALGRLSWLSMVGTAVGDGAIEDLGACRSLAHLSLVGTQVTRAGAGRLRDLLPSCAVAA